ncbi:SAM-dependent methyltransferase TehB [Proteus hauseri]|uniref:SAM-dependent methyltransferase TehB n=1 Tax=Proteus hauseri TaxID=183417 RepID=UPI0032DB0CEF
MELVSYKAMPEWSRTSIPLMLLERHNTKEGTYAQMKVLQGSMTFVVFNDDGSQVSVDCDSEHQPPLIQPQQWHKIDKASDDVRCQLSFLCAPEDKLFKENDLSLPHSEVRYMSTFTQPCKVLDLGAGRGRNSFYLASQGYDVTALDINASHIDAIEAVKAKTGLAVKSGLYDINEASLTEKYDIILSTVVLMFCQRERIEAIIKNMQNCTNVNGINVIVCPVETQGCDPAEIPFKTFLHQGELADCYKDWEIIKYNENPGHLHKTDANGNRIELNFATLIARKK